jgi:hypothetical protein
MTAAAVPADIVPLTVLWIVLIYCTVTTTSGVSP